MAFNGSGVFNRIYSWVTDAANGIDVSSTRTDTDTNDIASGLSNCICKDGQTTVTANIPMAGFKFTGLGTGSATTDSVNLSQLIGYSPGELCEFRLTLTSGVPVTTSDVTAAATFYVTPYKGNRVALYDGASWHVRTSSELSGTLGHGSPNAMIDVFLYDNSGTVAIHYVAWSSDTARVTGLALQNGVLVKSGDATKRYFATYRTNSAGDFEDSISHRFIWNYYNRVRRPMLVLQDVSSYTYTTATIRQANGSTANQLDMVVGWSEDPVSASYITSAYNSTGGVLVRVGIGTDSTTAFDASCVGGNLFVPTSATGQAYLRSDLQSYPAVGRHTMAALEYSNATGTTTWNVAAGPQNGIRGEIWG